MANCPPQLFFCGGVFARELTLRIVFSERVKNGRRIRRMAKTPTAGRKINVKKHPAITTGCF